jgi:hypothetical protein
LTNAKNILIDTKLNKIYTQRDDTIVTFSISNDHLIQEKEKITAKRMFMMGNGDKVMIDKK